MTHSLLAGADWLALVWAVPLAALVAWSSNHLASRGGAVRTASDVLADTIIGATAGMALALGLTALFPSLQTFGAFTALSCVGAAGGRRFYDFAVGAAIALARLRLGLKAKDGDGIEVPK